MRGLLSRQAGQGFRLWGQWRPALPQHFLTYGSDGICGHELATKAGCAFAKDGWPFIAEAGSWDRRTFASSAGEGGDEVPADPPLLPMSEGERKDTELFYRQIWGAEAPPPSPEEMEVLPMLRKRFHQIYGPTALPTAAAMQEIFEDFVQTLEEMEEDSEEEMEGDSDDDSEDESEEEDMEDAEDTEEVESTLEVEEMLSDVTEEEILDTLGPDEFYEFTDEEMEYVESIARAPKKVQRLALQQDLKRLMQNPDAEPVEDEDEDSPESEAEAEEKQKEREKAERLFDMRTVSINRTCKKNKGGGLFRFQAFVVIGNGDGIIGYGMGKAAEVVGAVDKAYLDAERNLYYVERYRRHTIYEETQGKCTKTKVKVWPRPLGSGIRCNDTLANICALAGIQDIRAKVHGSRHKMNMVKAFFQALDKQRTPQEIAEEKGLVAREIAGVYR